jgi:integrase
LRASDCLAISPANYNAENKLITIQQKKTAQTVTIPTSQQLSECLETSPPDDNPLTSFIDRYNGKPTTYHALNQAWNALKRKAKIPDELTFHDQRRTVAVGLYEISKDLRVVEQMLGHHSLSSTAHYLEHRDPAKLRPYLDAMFIPKGPV